MRTVGEPQTNAGWPPRSARRCSWPPPRRRSPTGATRRPAWPRWPRWPACPRRCSTTTSPTAGPSSTARSWSGSWARCSPSCATPCGHRPPTDQRLAGLVAALHRLVRRPPRRLPAAGPRALGLGRPERGRPGVAVRARLAGELNALLAPAGAPLPVTMAAAARPRWAPCSTCASWPRPARSPRRGRRGRPAVRQQPGWPTSTCSDASTAGNDRASVTRRSVGGRTSASRPPRE